MIVFFLIPVIIYVHFRGKRHKIFTVDTGSGTVYPEIKIKRKIYCFPVFLSVFFL